MAISIFCKFSIVSAQTEGSTQFRHFADKEEWGQFCADVFYEQPLKKLYTAKNVLGQEYYFKLTLYRGQAGLQDRQKSEGLNAI